MSGFSEQIPYFLINYLSRPASALPKGALWVLDFQGIDDVKPSILATASIEPQKWNIEAGLNCLLDSDIYNKKKGCLFVQGVAIPEESVVANPEGPQYNHFIRTLVGAGRNPYSGLNVTFLDTNISFVENIIRPWVVTTARLGLIARKNKNDKYRCTLSFYKLGVLTPKDKPFILQKFTFYGVCPVEIDSQEYNYAPATSPKFRQVKFIYHYYTTSVIPNTNLAIKNNNTVNKVTLATDKVPYRVTGNVDT
jgi:hypothetical protein